MFFIFLALIVFFVFVALATVVSFVSDFVFRDVILAVIIAFQFCLSLLLLLVFSDLCNHLEVTGTVITCNVITLTAAMASSSCLISFAFLFSMKICYWFKYFCRFCNLFHYFECFFERKTIVVFVIFVMVSSCQIGSCWKSGSSEFRSLSNLGIYSENESKVFFFITFLFILFCTIRFFLIVAFQFLIDWIAKYLCF